MTILTNRIVLLVIYLCVSFSGKTQLFYSDTIPFNALNPISSLGHLKNQCEDSIITAILPDIYHDVAITDETFYLYGLPLYNPNGYYGLKMVKFNSTIIQVLHIDISNHIRGMAADRHGLLYLCGNDSLWTYNPTNREVLFVGHLPAGVTSEGDLTFRHRKLLLNTAQGQMVQIDLQDISNSKVLFEMDTLLPPIYGMATVNVSCDSVVTYAIGYDEDERAIFEVDFSKKRLVKLCDTELYAQGLASFSEADDPGCTIQINLNADDLSSLDYIATSDCPSSAALTNAPFIRSDLTRIDSVKVCFYAGKRDAGYELLDAGAQVDGIGIRKHTECLTFYNLGNAEASDFETQLSQLQYNNQNPDGVTPGQRIFAFTAHSDLVCGDTSYTYLNVTGDNDLTYELDWTHPDCIEMDNGNIDLLNVNGGIPPHAFSIDGNTFTDLPSFTNLNSGQYTVYIKDDQGCLKWTEVELIAPMPGLFDVGPDITINNGESVTLSINADVPTFDYILWTSNAEIDCPSCMSTSITVTDNSIVTIEALDTAGCLYEVSVAITVIKSFDIYAPNVFSPNDDYYNDYFYLQSEEDFVIEEMNIYDRRGQKVFELTSGSTNRMNEGWSGHILGERANQGVYVWTAIINTPKGRKSIFGDITLTR